MTREEAIQILQNARITSFRPNGTAKVKEAMDMAIEALSDHSGEVTEMVKKDLTSDSTLKVNVQGEWIDVDNYYRLATCSHCRKVTMFEKWGEYTKPYNYCPNCGAKMTKGGAE